VEERVGVIAEERVGCVLMKRDQAHGPRSGAKAGRGGYTQPKDEI
jgi:hypothetical protein